MLESNDQRTHPKWKWGMYEYQIDFHLDVELTIWHITARFVIVNVIVISSSQAKCVFLLLTRGLNRVRCFEVRRQTSSIGAKKKNPQKH